MEKTGIKMMLDVIFVGNAITDVIGSCDENFLIENNIQKGGMNLVDENDLVGQIIRFTNKNLRKGFIFITRPSIKNCLKYLKTLKYVGLSGVPRLTNNNAFFILSRIF